MAGYVQAGRCDLEDQFAAVGAVTVADLVEALGYASEESAYLVFESALDVAETVVVGVDVIVGVLVLALEPVVFGSDWTWFFDPTEQWIKDQQSTL